MQRILWGGVVLFVMLGVAGAVLQPLVPAASAQPPPEVQFDITGVGRVGLEPDYGIVVFAVRSISRTAQGAIGENARAIDALTKALRTFTRPGDRIETAGFQLGPERGGFVVVNQVQVRTTQVKEVGRLIDLAVGAGADDISAVAFGREHTKEAAQRAVREAMQRARENAEAVAAGLGMRVQRITHIEPSLEQIEGPLVARDYAPASRPAMEPTQIQPGRLTLTAHVRVRFLLGP